MIVVMIWILTWFRREVRSRVGWGRIGGRLWIVCLDEVEELKLGISRDEQERYRQWWKVGSLQLKFMAAFVVVGNDGVTNNDPGNDWGEAEAVIIEEEVVENQKPGHCCSWNHQKWWWVVLEGMNEPVHACVLSGFSCVRLFATIWTVACQAPLFMGFSRQKYWNGLPFPSLGNLPHPGIIHESSAWQVDSLPLSCLGSCIPF